MPFSNWIGTRKSKAGGKRAPKAKKQGENYNIITITASNIILRLKVFLHVLFVDLCMQCPLYFQYIITIFDYC